MARPPVIVTLVLLAAVTFALASVVGARGLASPEESGADSDGGAAADESGLDDELRAQLENLGYISATKTRRERADKVGLARTKRRKTPGQLAIYTPCGWGRRYRELGFGDPRREARLIDMNGKVLHRWHNPNTGTGNGGWANVKVGPNGSLYVVHFRASLSKVDWNSKILWTRTERYHHDLDLAPDGTVVALVEQKRTVVHHGKRINVLDNGFAFVTPDGSLQRIVWLYPALARQPFVTEGLDDYFARAEQLRAGHHRPRSRLERRLARRLQLALRDVDRLGLHDTLGGVDLFHANSVEVLPADPAGRWQAGDILTSFRNLHTVAVVDGRTGAVRWHWGRDVLHRQHDPSLLANGNILIFDNRQRETGSRIIEVDPGRGRIVWSYEGTAQDPFFSLLRGQAQQLRNGNTLIVSSQAGRAFEVTRRGDIVWEFFGHDIRDGYRVAIRMHRLEGSELRSVQRKLRTVRR